MFFHNRSGWGIAFRILMVLLLIAGAIALTRVAFYKGYTIGAQAGGKDYSGYQGKEKPLDYHYQKEYLPQKGYLPQHGYYSGKHYPPGGGFGGGALHIILGVLGLFLLVTLILGFGGMSMYHRYSPIGWGYRGPGHYYNHHGHCPYCSGDHLDEEAPEVVEEKKPKKK